jgi:hypothetical protein
MNARTFTFTVCALFGLAGAVGYATTAAAPAASRLHFVMEAKKIAGPVGGSFVVTPVGPGSLEADSGKFTFTVSERHVVRSGQPVTIFAATSTWTGKLGTLVLRERIDDVGAGNGYRAGTGVWSLVRGTGQYEGVSGSGRLAYVTTPPERVFFRYEGLLSKA